jgi:oligopeptide/dipeptide ABC transporter ATP-binding protein
LTSADATLPDYLDGGATGQPSAGPLLEVTDLKTSFTTAAGVVRAVDGVSFALERGRTIGIVGESGSGKTVLSRSIMNLLPKRTTIQQGSVRFAGHEILGLGSKEMQSYWGAEMSMVFQDPMTSLNPVVKIGRQITESLRQHLDMSKGEAADRAVELLRSVGIPEPARRVGEYPHQLSGGMRQRVVIAIALACDPRLLMADEPTTALDVTVQAQILDLLGQKQAERHMTMVLVTHDLGVVATRTDEIIVMYAGQVVEQAPTWRLFSSYRMPYTEALMKSIPRLEFPSHTRLLAVPGRPPNLLSAPPGCPFAPRCSYAQDRCQVDKPPLVETDTPGHSFACWYPVGSAEASEALEINRRRGLIHTGADPTKTETIPAPPAAPAHPS